MMNREVIGSVVDWHPANEDVDMAYDMALCFLKAALGQPPDGVTIGVCWQGHDYGAYPAVAVEWPDFGAEPWDFIRRAESALAEFVDAIDWARIRPSNFTEESDEAGEEDMSSPHDYLLTLADAFCAALKECPADEQEDWMEMFLRDAEQLGIDRISWGNISQEEQVRRILSPDNPDSFAWARARLQAGVAKAADPDDPETVINQLCWPMIPGCRFRED
jgi:hypothetical protein